MFTYKAMRFCIRLKRKSIVIYVFWTLLIFILYRAFFAGNRIGWSDCMLKPKQTRTVVNYGFDHRPEVEQEVPEIKLIKKGYFKRHPLPLLTLFTTWSYSNSNFNYNFTLKNWASLRPFVRLILFSNEPDVSETIRKSGWQFLFTRMVAAELPVMKYMFLDARAAVDSAFYGYANANVLFTDSLIQTLVSILDTSGKEAVPKLIIGRGTNVTDITIDRMSWPDISNEAKLRGKLMKTNELVYFITSDNYPWELFPELVIPGFGLQEWLLFDARKHDFISIDTTETVLAINRFNENENQTYSRSKEYNINLLERKGRYVPYHGGTTLCTSNYTTYGSGCVPFVHKRATIDQHCDIAV